MIRLEQVGKHYPNDHVGLHEVPFRMRHGEVLFVTGHSGVDKSTLLRLILVMGRPTNGKLLLGGRDLGRTTTAQVPSPRRQIGVVSQNHQLLTNRTVTDNIALPLQILGTPKPEIVKHVVPALERVNLREKGEALSSDLFTGQQQRVGIAHAIAHQLAPLLTNEPIGSLNSRLASEIMGVFEDINRLGTAVLIASRDLALITRMRHCMLALQRGRIIANREDEA